MNYWEESVRQALDDLNIKLSEQLIVELSEAMKISHEQYGMAHPSPDSSIDIFQGRIKKLENELEEERQKRKCPQCDGIGFQRTDGPAHYSLFKCNLCNGSGRI